MSKDGATLPSVIVAFNLLLDRIEKAIEKLGDDNADLINAFEAGKEKLLKHFRKTNWIYCISLILDPRHKTKRFQKTEWGKQMQEYSITKFEELYKNSYYKEQNKDVETEKTKKSKQGLELDLEDFYSEENNKDDSINSNEEWRTEIDDYYAERTAPVEVDILEWWKVHSKMYPNLSRMARDILSVQATSVEVERLFSQCSLIMTNRRNSLNDDTFKALICLHCWAKSDLRNAIFDTDFFDTL